MKIKTIHNKKDYKSIFKLLIFMLLIVKLVWIAASTIWLYCPWHRYFIWSLAVILIDLLALRLYCKYVMKLKPKVIWAVLISIILLLPIIDITIMHSPNYIKRDYDYLYNVLFPPTDDDEFLED